MARALFAMCVLSIIPTIAPLASCLEEAKEGCKVAQCGETDQVLCLKNAQHRCSEDSQTRYTDASELFKVGQFREAANLGETINTSESLTLAAEALAIDGQYYPRDDKEAQFQRGRDLANRAIARNPCNSEAHVQYAHTIGRIVENKSLFGKLWEGVKAKFEAGELNRMNEALLKAKNLDPKNARACTGLATFHAAIVSQNVTLFDATKEEVLANYQCALDNEPDSNIVHLAYAKGLWLLNKDKNVSLVRQHFEKAVALDPKDAYEQIAHKDARMCLDELNSQGTLEQCMKRT